MEKLIEKHLLIGSNNCSECQDFNRDLSESKQHANITKEVAILFAGFIRNEINADRLRHYDPTENGKWAYWKVSNGGIAKQLTTSELFDIYLETLK